MIIIGYPGIGKSTLAAIDCRFIDLESSLFKIDGERSDNWYKPYCAVAEDLSKQGYSVFVSSHSAVREALRGSQEDVAVVYPSIELRDEWVRKLEERYLRTYSNGNLANANKDRMAYARAQRHYVEDISELESCDIPNKICLASMDYDLRGAIFMNENKYRIPEWILVKIPDDFWKVIHDELNKTFEDVTFETLPFFVGTVGWIEALTTTCKKLNLNDILEYYDDLELYYSDVFDDELYRILGEKLGMKV